MTNSTFGKHPSSMLQELYKQRFWQCQNPKLAKIIFLSLDANWDYNFESLNPAVVMKIEEYLQDGVSFWEKEGVHHPFLMQDYKKGDGYRFHLNFSKLNISSESAKDVSFVELLNVPTYGMSTAQENRAEFQRLIDKSHIKNINDLLFSDRKKIVFIPKAAYRYLLKLNQNDRLLNFDLEPESLTGEEFVNIHNRGNSFIFVCNHFSASNTNEFYSNMGLLCNSFLNREATQKTWWKVSYVGSWNGERVTEKRYILAKDVFEVKEVLCKHFNIHRVEKDFSQLNFVPVNSVGVQDELIWE